MHWHRQHVARATLDFHLIFLGHFRLSSTNSESFSLDSTWLLTGTKNIQACSIVTVYCMNDVSIKLFSLSFVNLGHPRTKSWRRHWQDATAWVCTVRGVH